MTAHLLAAVAHHHLPLCIAQATAHCQWGEPWSNPLGAAVVMAIFFAIGTSIGGGTKPKPKKKSWW